MPSVSQTALRVPTLETNLEASADNVQQALRENRPDTFPTRDPLHDNASTKNNGNYPNRRVFHTLFLQRKCFAALRS